MGLLAVGTALAEVPLSGQFTATRECPAGRNIRGENPGAVHLQPGRGYRALARNKPDGDYVRIQIPGVTPAQRWVHRECGRLEAGQPRPQQISVPFFDTIDNPVRVDFPRGGSSDVTPLPPPSNHFDQQVLELCGDLGDRVSQQRFRDLLSADESRLLLARLADASACRGQRCQPGPLSEQLGQVWFRVGGFRHLFCGEPSAGGMGGLHYRGRYLQMQQRGWGGLLDTELGIEEILPRRIYTIGVEFQWQGRRVRDPVKGYPYALDAADLLVEATRAWADLKRDRGVCLATIDTADGSPAYHAVLVVRDNAIRTFYPDATPDLNLQRCRR